MPSSVRYLPLVDTHAHLNLEDFETDLDDLLERSRLGRFPEIKGRQIEDPVFRPYVAGIVCPAVDLATSLSAIELAKSRDCVYASVGFHPNHTADLSEEEWRECEKLALGENARLNKIVAIGETGLDLSWDASPLETQLKFFRRELELGERLGLPVIVHSRESNDVLMKTFREFYSDRPRPSDFERGVVHSFNGSLEQAEELVDLGFYLGFGGFVTYTSKKFSELWKVAERVPADRILLETNCPYLTPHPLRGKLERNEPLATLFAAKRLAELRGVSVDEIANQTAQNAVRFFKLPNLQERPEQYSS